MVSISLQYSRMKSIVKMNNILLYFIFIKTQNLFAQRDRIRFEKHSIENGFSQRLIVAICQDHKGNLWFGSYDGMNRNDRYRFKIFRNKPDNPTSLSQNLKKDIYEDRFGTLWVDTEGGLNRFDREKETFIRCVADVCIPGSISNNRIRDFSEDHKGEIWIATEVD